MHGLTLAQRLIEEVRPYRAHLWLLLALGLLATPIALLLPLPLKIVVDHVIGQDPVPGFVSGVLPGAATAGGPLLAVAIALLLLVTLLNLLQAIAKHVLGEYVGEKMVLDFRSRLLEHAQRLSLAFHDARGVADSVYRIQWDAPAVRWLTIDGAISLAAAVVMLAAMTVVTAFISLKLALIALAVSPVLVFLTRLASRRLRDSWHEAHALQNSAFGILQETLAGLRVVAAFGQQERERRRFLRRSVEGLDVRLRAAWTESSLDLLFGLTVAIGTGAVLAVGVRDIGAGVLTLGELLLVMAYLVQLYTPLQTIGKQIAAQQRSLASFERTLELLDHAPAVIERPGARSIAKAKGRIAFENVWFGYHHIAPVLRDVSFAVDAGARVGIAGPTGAGKTTLLGLLLRFYDPTEGRVLLDGVDLRDYKLGELREQFAVAPQEPMLFSASIADNISYARPGADEADIVAAAQAANAHDFIVQLPDGYGTVVGERGLALSGGERQRVSLARAFLKDAPILVLDEPTSSIDTHTETKIIEAMDRLMRGRTTFMIAHRTATLRGCDLLLTIEEGRVAKGAPDVAAAIDHRGRSGQAG